MQTATHNIPKLHLTALLFITSVGEALLYLLPLGFLISQATCDICMSGIAICFLIRCYLTRQFDWLTQTWVKISLVFSIYLCIASIWTINPISAFLEALSFVRFPVFASAIAYWLLQSPKNHERLKLSLIFFTIFACMDVIVQYIIGVNLIGRHAELVPIDASLFNPELVWNTSTTRRLTGLSNKWNIAGKLIMIMIPTMVLCALYFTRSNRFKHKLLAISIIALMAISIPITGERTPIVLMGVCTLLTYLLVSSIRKPMLYSACVAGIALCGILLSNPHLMTRVTKHIYSVAQVTILDINNQIVTSTSKENKPIDHDHGAIFYKMLIENSWSLFLNHPITGIGIKQMPETCQKEIPNNPNINYNGQQKFCPTSPANIYLELLTNTGVIGFSLFMMLIFHWFKYIYARKNLLLVNKPDIDQIFMIGIFIAWLARFFPIIVGSSLFFSWYGLTIWWFIGWLYAYLNNREKPV